MSMTEKRFIAMCMALLLLFFFFPSVAFAENKGKAAEALIQVSCDASGIDKGFAFTLFPESTEETQEVKCGMLMLKDGEEGSFAVAYTYPGVYHYEASQVKDGADGILYDDTVYTIDVYVTENENGEMSVEPVIYVKGNNEKKEKLSFVNKSKDTKPEEKTEKKNNMNSGKGTINKAAKTEDTSNMMTWICLLCSSLIFSVTLVGSKEIEEVMHS